MLLALSTPETSPVQTSAVADNLVRSDYNSYVLLALSTPEVSPG